MPGAQRTGAARLPGIDRLLNEPSLAPHIARWGRLVVKGALRDIQNQLRQEGSPPEWAARADGYFDAVANLMTGHALTPVFNLTGTLIHTNLGRAVLSDEMLAAARDVATAPSTVELDLETGKRGDRDRLVESMLIALTGAEAATVVNNNAAAVLLTLNTLARDRGVLVSRGELVEIGGSFRLPDIMASAGCRLEEVGTTNRTHERDFERSVHGDVALLLKVHPSNYRIEGFTRAVAVPALAAIAARHRLPLAVDLGSGSLVDLTRYGLPYEPTPAATLADGADVVTFSGDKLLGSAQAGIVVGRRDLIERMKANPMKRALRVDKITLAILAVTLRLYQQPETLAERLPLLRMLTRSVDDIARSAMRVTAALERHLGPGYQVAEAASECRIGSGSLPAAGLPSRAVRVSAATDGALTRLAARLRRLSVPIIGRHHDGALWLDLRAVADDDPLLRVLAELDVE